MKDGVMKVVKEIWGQELPSAEFSLGDDFFELGGNSLRLISVLDKLQKSPELKNMDKLTIVELFDHPVFRDLVLLVEEKTSGIK